MSSLYKHIEWHYPMVAKVAIRAEVLGVDPVTVALDKISNYCHRVHNTNHIPGYMAVDAGLQQLENELCQKCQMSSSIGTNIQETL